MLPQRRKEVKLDDVTVICTQVRSHVAFNEHGRCPLLAQSRHDCLHRTCLLFGGKADMRRSALRFLPYGKFENAT
jgi:hypothetical protein